MSSDKKKIIHIGYETIKAGDAFLQYVQCSSCGRDLIKREDSLACLHCGKEHFFKDGILIADDTESLFGNKWDLMYEAKLKNQDYLKEYEEYKKNHFSSIYKQINEYKSPKGSVYLEIGCGQFFFGSDIASEAGFVIGIDFSWGALRIAQKMLQRKGVKNYLLIKGNIDKMPIIRSSSVDLIYGGGVIEHFDGTQECLGEIYRILRPGGVSFNTVPFLNIASLTYRQIWGNIPDCPVLKPLAEFFHMKMLGGRHMRFGYEKSFTRRKMKRMHRAAGFSKIITAQFRVNLDFEYIPFKPIRRVSVYLAENFSPFWPMIKIIAKK